MTSSYFPVWPIIWYNWFHKWPCLEDPVLMNHVCMYKGYVKDSHECCAVVSVSSPTVCRGFANPMSCRDNRWVRFSGDWQKMGPVYTTNPPSIRALAGPFSAHTLTLTPLHNPPLACSYRWALEGTPKSAATALQHCYSSNSDKRACLEYTLKKKEEEEKKNSAIIPCGIYFLKFPWQ